MPGQPGQPGHPGTPKKDEHRLPRFVDPTKKQTSCGYIFHEYVYYIYIERDRDKYPYV